MSSFEDVEFSVVASSEALTDIERDSGNLKRFTCVARFATMADLDAMQDYYTQADFKQVLGTLGFNAHIQAGYGSGLLTIMVGRNHIRARTSFLVGVNNISGPGRYPYYPQATLSFVMLT